MTPSSVNLMKETLQSATETALCQNDNLPYKTKKTPEDVIKRTMKEAYAEFIESRTQMTNKYVIGSVEQVMWQHFTVLVGKDGDGVGVDAPTLPYPGMLCSDCRQVEGGGKYCDNFEKYPPKDMRTYFVEECLTTLAKEDTIPCRRKQRAYTRASSLFHSWIRGELPI